MLVIKTIIFLTSLFLASQEALSESAISADNALNGSNELQRSDVKDSSISYEDDILYTERQEESDEDFRKDIDLPIDSQKQIPQNIKKSPPRKENDPLNNVIEDLKQVSQSGNDITVSHLSKLLLWFLRGSSLECTENEQSIENSRQLTKQNEDTARRKNWYLPKNEEKTPAFTILQLNSGQPNHVENTFKPDNLNKMAANAVQTNTLLRRELVKLKSKRQKVNPVRRKKRDIVSEPNVIPDMFTLSQAEPNQCKMDLDRDTAQILNKISLKMNTNEVEELSRLLSIFLLSSDIFSGVSSFPNNLSSEEKHDTIIKEQNITPPDNNQVPVTKKEERERQIQALSNIIHRRKRSIVDFDKGYHRDFYAHKIDSFPHSMRTKQTMIEHFPYSVRTENQRNGNDIAVRKLEKEDLNLDSKLIQEESSMAGKKIDAFPDMERTKIHRHSGTKHSSNKHRPNKLKHKNYGKTKAQKLVQMSRELIPSSEKVEHEKNDSNIKIETLEDSSQKDIKQTPGPQKMIKEKTYPIHLLQSESFEAEKIQDDKSHSKLHGLVNVELYDENRMSRPSEIITPRSDSSFDEDFLDLLEDMEDDNEVNLSNNKQLEMEDLLKRKEKYETHDKRKHKRSITDFDKLDTESSNYNNRDQKAKLTNLDEFPDTESTRAERIHIRIGDSIFGLKSKIRRPITDFEDVSVNPKYRNGIHHESLINVNQFPRTERLMATRIKDIGKRISRVSSGKKKNEIEKNFKHGRKHKNKIYHKKGQRISRRT